MADVSKIKLPNNTEVNIKDSRISGVDSTPTSESTNVVTSGGVHSALSGIEHFYFVQGSSSQAGNSTSGEYLSTKWEGTIPGVSTATNGLKLAYRIATNAGVGTAGVVLSIDGTHYYPVVIQKNTLVTTHYPVGATVLMVFNSTQTASAYLTSNTKTTVTGCWQIMEYDSNTNTYQRLYASSGDTEYPITTRYNTTTGESYYAEYGRYSTGVTLNPSTNAITASKFIVSNGTSSQFLKADGSVDSNTPQFATFDSSGISDYYSHNLESWNRLSAAPWSFAAVGYGDMSVSEMGYTTVFDVNVSTREVTLVFIYGYSIEYYELQIANDGEITVIDSGTSDMLTGVSFNGTPVTVTNGVAAITATIPSAPGTLDTTATTAQSTNASEALSGSITLHKVAKTGTYSDLIGTPTEVWEIDDANLNTGTFNARIKNWGITTSGYYSVAEGYNCKTGGSDTSNGQSINPSNKFGKCAHAEGNATLAKGSNSHSEGIKTFAAADNTHAEGYYCVARGGSSHAEGRWTTAYGSSSHAEGYGSQNQWRIGSMSPGYASITGSDGSYTANKAHELDVNDLVECNGNYDFVATVPSSTTFTTKGTSLGTISTATQLNVPGGIAYRNSSHVEGSNGQACGDASHVEGFWNQTLNEYEHAEGKYNKSNRASGNANCTIHSIGIGTSHSERANAVEVMQNGDVYIKGIGSYDGTNYSSASTLQSVVGNIPAGLPSVTSSDNGKVLQVSSGAWAVGGTMPTQKVIALDWDSNDHLNFPSSVSPTSITDDMDVILYGDGFNTYVDTVMDIMIPSPLVTNEVESLRAHVTWYSYYPEEAEGNETYPAYINLSWGFSNGNHAEYIFNTGFEENNGVFALDSQSSQYSKELTQWDIESTIDDTSQSSDDALASIGAIKTYVYNKVNPAVASSQPSGGFAPNIFYNLGTITGTVTFSLASATDNTIVNHYYWTFDTSSTAPTITWPSGVSWIGGSAPAISASKHYEISILNNIGTYMEV